MPGLLDHLSVLPPPDALHALIGQVAIAEFERVQLRHVSEIVHVGFTRLVVRRGGKAAIGTRAAANPVDGTRICLFAVLYGVSMPYVPE